MPIDKLQINENLVLPNAIASYLKWLMALRYSLEL